MQASDARAALDTVPGWAGARVARLGGGETNTAWRVEHGGRRAVMKLDEASRDVPFASRRQEAAVQAAAAAQGLAGRVLFSDDGLLLTEYVDGRPWTAADSADPRSLAALAATLRRVHALPATGRAFDATSAAMHYADALGGADPEVARRCLETVKAAPAPSAVCCCHNDLVAANILLADGIRLIDWEFAADNDPLFDLATIVVEHRLSDANVERLMDAYFEGGGSRWRGELDAMVRVYRALAWLWRESLGRI